MSHAPPAAALHTESIIVYQKLCSKAPRGPTTPLSGRLRTGTHQVEGAARARRRRGVCVCVYMCLTFLSGIAFQVVKFIEPVRVCLCVCRVCACVNVVCVFESAGRQPCPRSTSHNGLCVFVCV